MIVSIDPQWVVDRIPYVDDFGPSVALGVVSNNRLICGVVYNDYYPQYRTMQVSIAADSPMWARRGNIAGLLAYPFLQLDINLLWTSTPVFNVKALKANRHIGFRYETTLEDRYGPGLHMDIARMKKSEYLEIYGDLNGKVEPLAAARA